MTTTRERADLGFGDELEAFNPAEWVPKPARAVNDKPKPKREETAKAAAAAGFRSREPKPAAAKPDPEPRPAAIERAGEAIRRRRTGRNAQFNLKARPETIAAYCAIADRMGWGLGETLERAVELLEKYVPGAK